MATKKAPQRHANRYNNPIAWRWDARTRVRLAQYGDDLDPSTALLPF